KDADNPFKTISTIQVEGAASSGFIESLGGMTFEAELGRYETHLDAFNTQTKWANALRECYPIMKFSIKEQEVTGGTIMYTYPILRNESPIRVFTCSFVILYVFSTHDLSFRFPQAQKGGILKNEILAFIDYTPLPGSPDDSPFTERIYSLLEHAKVGFKVITGEFEDYDKVATFSTFYKLPDYDDAVIEECSNGYRYYVVNVCKNVDKATFEAKGGPFFQKLMAALGGNFAYRELANGQAVHFVRCDDALDVAMRFEYTEKDGLYSARLLVYPAN
ncbi:MAG: hypothetical protein GXY09_08475, partial [Bacteroidales bacterium]|nr:hypothetical protein [Bacteroidales bacterium]